MSIIFWNGLFCKKNDKVKLLMIIYVEATTLKTRDCSSSKQIQDHFNIKSWGLCNNNSWLEIVNYCESMVSKGFSRFAIKCSIYLVVHLSFQHVNNTAWALIFRRQVSSKIPWCLKLISVTYINKLMRVSALLNQYWKMLEINAFFCKKTN